MIISKSILNRGIFWKINFNFKDTFGGLDTVF